MELAMELAVIQVASKPKLELADLLAIHRALMRHTRTPEAGGQMRTVQNWIGGNDYNPCGADFVPPPPELSPAYSTTWWVPQLGGLPPAGSGGHSPCPV